jgi:hypothetical protein
MSATLNINKHFKTKQFFSFPYVAINLFVMKFSLSNRNWHMFVINTLSAELPVESESLFASSYS